MYNLKNEEKFSKKVIKIEEIKSRSAKHCNLDDLPHQLSNFLKKEGIKLFKHQCELASLVRDGKNVIITTPTASGKTLAFSLPILETFTKDETATALFLYPANALIADQRGKFLDYEEKTGIRMDPYFYNNDTNREMRIYIRENARTLLTTPHMLHLILYWKHQWASFYSNLKYVVIDEAHSYSGIFGSNVAQLIRRLRRVCNYYGSDPQFILSSATLANPLEFSESLVGKQFEIVDEDTSHQGTKHFILYNPYHQEQNPSIMLETRNMFIMFVKNGLQTLCFTKTKNDAERIVSMAKRYLEKNEPELMESLDAYRAGYTREERRLIEHQLQTGDLKGVTSTNALELGVDIGSLDAVIISSYPGTLMSTWQQAGRAGRGTKDSVVIFLASNDPLNQYIIQNPEYILSKKHEHATIDLKNEYILKKHLMCTISELDLSEEDLLKYFDLDHSFMIQLKNKGNISYHDGKWRYEPTRSKYPALEDKLNYIAPTPYQVIFERKVLENLSHEDACDMAFIGADYRYKGRKFIVKEFDLVKKTFYLEKEVKKSHKGSWKKISIKELNTPKYKVQGELDLHFGDIKVEKTYFTFEKKGDKRANFKQLNVPPTSFKTKAFWFEIPQSIVNQLQKEVGYDVVDDSIHGLLNALTAMFPLHVLCGRCDLVGYYNSKDVLNHKIYFYDSQPGGVGLAEKCVETFVDLCKVTLDMLKSCKCKNGCGFCIHTSPCGSKSKKVNKLGTILLLEKILEEFGGKVSSEDIALFEPETVPIKLPEKTNPITLLEFIEAIEKDYQHIILKSINNALEADPKHPELLIQKGVIQNLVGEYELAKKSYQESLAVDNDSTYLYEVLKLLLTKELPQEVLIITTTLIELIPESNEILLFKGQGLELLNDIEGAISCYEMVLSIDPNNMDAYQYLISIS